MRFRCKRCKSIFNADYWNETYRSQVTNNDDFVKIQHEHEGIKWYCPHCSWQANEEGVKVELVKTMEKPIPGVLEELMEEADNLPEEFVRHFLIEYNPEDPENIENMEVINKGGRVVKERSEFENIKENSIKITIVSSKFKDYAYNKIKREIIDKIKSQKRINNNLRSD